MCFSSRKKNAPLLSECKRVESCEKIPREQMSCDLSFFKIFLLECSFVCLSCVAWIGVSSHQIIHCNCLYASMDQHGFVSHSLPVVCSFSSICILLLRLYTLLIWLVFFHLFFSIYILAPVPPSPSFTNAPPSLSIRSPCPQSINCLMPWVKLTFAWDFSPPHLSFLFSQVSPPLEWWHIMSSAWPVSSPIAV